MAVTLEDVKTGLGVTGNYQDETIRIYFDDVMDCLRKAGVPDRNITKGLVTRGVSDLWNYGAGDGRLSDYFYKRAAQASMSK